MKTATDEPTMFVHHDTILNGPMEKWTGFGCFADIVTGVEDGDSWATLYLMVSTDPGKGNATKLLMHIKEHYESRGFGFGGSVAITPAMKRVYEKCGVIEYGDEYFEAIEARDRPVR